MQTTEEAVHAVSARMGSDDLSFAASLKEVMNEPEVLRMAITLIDSQSAFGAKILFALSIGILIGIEQERNFPR